MLGFGPLLLAPMSETFGRRPVFLANLIIFTLLQIPTALVKSLPALITLRTITGFFGSVGIANGGGTISDMFPANERATVLGFYLLGPLIGPSLGPFLGGMIISTMDWRWIIWILLIVSTILSIVVYFCLFETYGPMVLEQRKKQLQQKDPHVTYYVEGASEEPTLRKIKAVCPISLDEWLLPVLTCPQNCTRALQILFTQPIVLTMSIYQAIIFATMFTLYATFTNVWTSPPYNFTKKQLALTYLAPAVGFIIAAIVSLSSFMNSPHSRLRRTHRMTNRRHYLDHCPKYYSHLQAPRRNAQQRHWYPRVSASSRHAWSYSLTCKRTTHNPYLPSTL